MSTSNKRQSNQSLSSSYGSIQAESASPRPIFRTGSKTNTSNILSATTTTQNNDTSGPHSPSSLTSGHPLLNNNSNNDDDEIEDITDIKPEDELNDYHLDLLNYKSITLENKGSVARDHMANERTFSMVKNFISFYYIRYRYNSIIPIRSQIRKFRLHLQ